MKVDWMWKGALVGAGLMVAPAAALAQGARLEIEEGEPIVSIEANGGVFDYIDDNMNDNTDLGGTWGARATLMPAWPVGLELAYVGALNNVGDQLDDNLDAMVASNGGEALVRANILSIAGVEQPEGFHIEPFVAAGAAYTNLQMVGDDRRDPTVREVFRQDDNLFSIPAAAGVQAVISENFSIGARVAYNYQFDNDLTRQENDDDSQSWGASASLGVAF